MKYLFTLFLLFFLNSDNSKEFNYDLLIGSWSQKSFANTTSTGVFTFKKDSIANLDLHDGKTEAKMMGMSGPYKIMKSKGILKVTMMGKEKEFEIQELNADVLIIENKKEGKDKQVFNRYKPKNN